MIDPNNVLLFSPSIMYFSRRPRFLFLTFLVFVGILGSLQEASSQGIFRDRRDVQPIAPTSVTPPNEVEEPGEEGMDPEGEGAEGAEGAEELQARPVLDQSTQGEAALNRERDEEANVSAPGVAALLQQTGQVRRLEVLPESSESAVSKVAPAAERSPTPEEDPGEDGADSSRPADPLDDKLASTFLTQPDARTFTFSIPAPRGQILDRKGYPLAQTKVVNYAAIEFPQWGDDADESRVQQYAAERIVHVNNLLGTSWDLAPKMVRDHYLNRRWMPLLFSGALTKSESERLRKSRVPGLTLLPVYLRHYPNEELLSHVIGYVGQRPPQATGPITNDEPIWGAGIGVQGLELAYNDQLTGAPGKVSQLYDGEGVKIREDTLSVPRPGHNVVTTIDIEMQRLAERLLRKRTHRGALVVMNCNNGDVMALASHPQFNPNDFVPSISTKKYTELVEDPEKPLFPRAFKASYPPASTFKVCTALAFLDSGYLYSGDIYPCPASWKVGNLVMTNWNSRGEGDMNVVSAISRSCNTWFYEVAIHAGADSMSSMALRLGLGEKTGLPLPENPGFIPTNRYWLQHYGHNMSDGDEANMSIGQGRVKTTPVQIARMMAAIGNGENVFKPRLVKQIQDVNHNIIEVFPAEVRNALAVQKSALGAVKKGMYDVVNASHGTGKSGYHDVSVAAKTGTGQWITKENRNIAWFAGYFPSRHPVYSFALIYEGEPDETVSGGKKAAPIVKEFLDEYLNTENLAEVRKLSDELKGDYEPSYLDEMDDFSSQPGSIFRGEGGVSSAPVSQPEQQAAKPEARPRPVRRESLFNRLFRRRRR